jgi:hypothetical protein
MFRVGTLCKTYVYEGCNRSFSSSFSFSLSTSNHRLVSIVLQWMDPYFITSVLASRLFSLLSDCWEVVRFSCKVSCFWSVVLLSVMKGPACGQKKQWGRDLKPRTHTLRWSARTVLLHYSTLSNRTPSSPDSMNDCSNGRYYCNGRQFK